MIWNSSSFVPCRELPLDGADASPNKGAGNCSPAASSHGSSNLGQGEPGLQLPDLSCSERFMTRLTCAGQDLVLSRVEKMAWKGSAFYHSAKAPAMNLYWLSLLRMRPAGSASTFSSPQVTLAPEWEMSHNAAFV